MKTIAIVNQKGGSAKTTTSVNLGAALALLKKKVLLIDVDAQGSSSSWLKANRESSGLYDAFTGNAGINSVICSTPIKNLSIIPASPWLINADKVLTREVGAESILKRLLEALEENWDFVLIDCPPALNILSINALVAAKEVLIPVETRIMALEGLGQLLNTVQTVTERLNSQLTVGGILLCRVDQRTRLSKEIVNDMKKRFQKEVFKTVIRENVRLAECPSFGKSIHDYDPSSTGAQDYMQAAKELIRRMRAL